MNTQQERQSKKFLKNCWRFLESQSSAGDSLCQFYCAAMQFPHVPLSLWGVKELFIFYQQECKKSLPHNWTELGQKNPSAFKHGCFVTLAEAFGLGVNIPPNKLFSRKDSDKVLNLLKLGAIKVNTKKTTHLYLKNLHSS